MLTDISGIEAKGRNGYFKVKRIVVWSDAEDEVNIEIYSKRDGDAAPIRFEGKRETMTQMVNDLQAAVKGMS